MTNTGQHPGDLFVVFLSPPLLLHTVWPTEWQNPVSWHTSAIQRHSYNSSKTKERTRSWYIILVLCARSTCVCEFVYTCHKCKQRCRAFFHYIINANKFPISDEIERHERVALPPSQYCVLITNRRPTGYANDCVTATHNVLRLQPNAAVIIRASESGRRDVM